jgi:hypothetical protein
MAEGQKKQLGVFRTREISVRALLHDINLLRRNVTIV